MSQNNQYISVAEFSKRANISKQRVYQLLNKTLKEFVKEVDGVKMLDIRALERYKSKENISTLEQENNQDLNKTLIDTIELLQEQLKTLNKQLEEKDNQINNLLNQLAEQTKLVSQAQSLHYNQQQERVQLIDSKEKKSLWKRFKKNKETEQI